MLLKDSHNLPKRNLNLDHFNPHLSQVSGHNLPKRNLNHKLTIFQINQKYLRNYLGLLTSKGLLFHNVISKVVSSSQQSKKGFPYCQINYTFIRQINKEEAEIVKFYRNLISKLDL